MKSRLVGVVALCVSLSLMACRRPSLTGQLTVNKRVQCVSYYGTGNATTVYVLNSPACDYPVQFTINWYGNTPSHTVTYRTNVGRANWPRPVARQDINGEIVSDARATMGLGPSTTHYSLQEVPVAQGFRHLELVSGEQQCSSSEPLRPAWLKGQATLSVSVHP